MSVAGGPDMIQDGLVLSLNAADRNSYPGSGTTWVDLSNVSGNATLVNSPIFSNANGGCIIFDAVDDYARVTTITSTTENFSISIWFNPVVLAAASSLNVIYIAVENSQTIRLYKNSNFADNVLSWLAYYQDTTAVTRAVLPGYTYSTNVWTNSTLVLSSAGTYKVYINGALWNTTTATNFSSWNLPNGYLDVGNRMEASVASVNIWDAELSAEQVLQNYNSTKTRFGL